MICGGALTAYLTPDGKTRTRRVLCTRLVDTGYGLCRECFELERVNRATFERARAAATTPATKKAAKRPKPCAKCGKVDPKTPLAAQVVPPAGEPEPLCEACYPAFRAWLSYGKSAGGSQ